MNGLEQVASKSFINCHTVGVDSIMFDDTPGKRVRVFIANKNHDLWRNVPTKHLMSVGIHDHHCDIALELISGNVYNIMAEMAECGDVRLNAFRYESAITGPGGRFVELPSVCRFRLWIEPLSGIVKMSAREMHTVYVPKGETAAWFVVEGEDDPAYESICYSNALLEHADFSELYKPMSVDYLLAKLSEIGILHWMTSANAFPAPSPRQT